MKKLLLTAGMIMAVSLASAQMFIGGAVGVETGTLKADGTKLADYTEYVIAPELGYSLNNNWDLGLGLMFGQTEPKYNDASILVKSTGWEVAPFARYTFLQFGDVKFMLRGTVGIGGSKVDGSKATNFGINIMPEVGWNFSEHFMLLAKLNCLNVGYNYMKEKDSKLSTSEFGLSANTNNLINTSNFQIGFVYKF